jgi:hypothetical protein
LFLFLFFCFVFVFVMGIFKIGPQEIFAWDWL